MDERWKDMYACIAPFTTDINGEQIEFYKIGIYVWWNDGFYWREQYLTKDTIKYVDFGVLSWLLNLMVKFVDEYMEEPLRV